jgi:glutathione peroxidase
MKQILVSIGLLFTLTNSNAQTSPKPESVHDFKVKAIDGSMIDFSTFKGKKILIVNTASKCGYTSQYKGLEDLSRKFNDKLVVVGFPSDNFGGQEYGKDEEVKEFCDKNYGVTFPLTTRVDVKGDKAIPLYQFLKSKDQNGVLDAEIKWNFNKFLIDENGKVVAYYPSSVKPDDEKIISWLMK